MSPPLKVLISGGGIAGNALAFWLSKLGYDITIVEWFPTLRASGLQLDLRGRGITVMKRMGIEEEFRAKSAPEQGLQFVNSSGKLLAQFQSGNDSGKGLQNFTTDYEIMRGDLCRIIYNATKSRTKYLFGTSIEHLEDKGASVEVLFRNGQTDVFDLVIGADGQRSRTRKMMLGSQSIDPFVPLSGMHVAYFTTPMPIKKGEDFNATAYIATNTRAVILRRQNPDYMQIYLMCKSKSNEFREVQQSGVEKQKEAMTKIFRGAGWQTDSILESMMKADDFYFEKLGLVKQSFWSQGRIALVGDAAYCPSSFTGMGTTSAIVGAYILAGEISRHCGSEGSEDGLQMALKSYETQFRPFIEQVQEGVSGDSFPYNLWPTTAFGITIFNWLIWLLAFLKVNVFGEWLLKENVKEWKLPHYNELLEG
ncbi:FAD binding domain protein [Colletotrichum tofieldiae]|uniref:FAD binding domain protein n=1 Tax=Colletotrichum tofieldiae TaxID=708197 RepID=A0A166PB91_9PEZI|nr:FAD binding domain protein [Colletotrichum tofieldiae]